MPIIYKDRVKEVASNKPNASTAFNLPDSAPAGFQSFDSAFATNDTLEYMATNGTDWESGVGTFTSGSPDTLTRTTLLASSTGSAIDWSSGGDVTIFCTASSRTLTSTSNLTGTLIPGGRLTVSSTSPIATGSSSTLYYLPYSSNVIRLKESGSWNIYNITSHSISFAGDAAGTYDIYIYVSSGVLALEKLVWSTTTTRATGYDTIEGKYYKAGDDTRLLLGTVYFDGTNIVDSATITSISNVYNRIYRRISITSGNTLNTYSSSTTRIYNNSSTLTRLRKVFSIGDEYFHVWKFATISNTGGVISYIRGGSAVSAEGRSYYAQNESWAMYNTLGTVNIGYQFFDLGQRTDGAAADFNYGNLAIVGEM